MSAFTVVGLWIDSQPVPVGVIAGHHDVTCGDDYFGEGLWAELVDADNEEKAQADAVAAVLALA